MTEDRQRKILKMIMATVLLVSMYFVAQEGAAYVNSDKIVTEKTEEEADGWQQKWCVVIDAGHGGADPGKVGVNGVLEKDINLLIANKLKTFLEASDVKVIMTRTDDGGLYDADASNKSAGYETTDCYDRRSATDLVVSIHQNSYHEEYVHGAQVCYYTTSETSKQLAELIQKRFVITLDAENKRQAKGNDSYYLLKKTARPIVIVECGFLSNREEAEKLNSDLYQEKAAWAIHMGIMQWLNAYSK